MQPSSPDEPEKLPPSNTNQPKLEEREKIVQGLDEKKESPSADGFHSHEIPADQINGPSVEGMPPQQVYVNTTMVQGGLVGLDGQFQSLGINENRSSGEVLGDGVDTRSDLEAPLKLFVGQVSLSRILVFSCC